MSESRLVLALLLIGRECGASFEPITERCNAKPKRTRITFDTPVKTVLILQSNHKKNIITNTNTNISWEMVKNCLS